MVPALSLSEAAGLADESEAATRTRWRPVLFGPGPQQSLRTDVVEHEYRDGVR
jgi:hypothetical protein